jgi:hypothetical protein
MLKLILISALTLPFTMAANADYKTFHKTNYKTYFGNCPSKTTAELTLKLVKEFEENSSLFSLKKKMLDEQWEDKYFLEDYKISFNPLNRSLTFYYDCPRPLMKVQIFKPDGNEHYNAVLVNNGKLVDPIYEVILRSENQIKGPLPFLAVQINQLNDGLQKKLSDLVEHFPEDLDGKLSEAIMGKNGELTLILALKGESTSVFLGEEMWEEKAQKLSKVIGYLEQRNKIPSIVNLTSFKKVVVKFSRTL